MTKYAVTLASSAERELSKLPRLAIARIMSRLEGLERDPRPQGCKKLQGGAEDWRIRVGDYRIIYKIDDKAFKVDVTRLRHRSEVYER